MCIIDDDETPPPGYLEVMMADEVYKTGEENENLDRVGILDLPPPQYHEVVGIPQAKVRNEDETAEQMVNTEGKKCVACWPTIWILFKILIIILIIFLAKVIIQNL